MIKPLEFGTDGIRGKANEYPFTNETLFIFGIAIAQWCKQKYGNRPSLLIGHDTRESCSRIKDALVRGLLTLDIDLVDAGEIPTPTVLQLMQQKTSFDCGIIISASHNAYEDNGIKLVDRIQGKLSNTDEQNILNNFYAIAEACLEASYTHPERSQNGTLNLWDDASTIYSNKTATYFAKNLLDGVHVVLDCANGATYKIAPTLFRNLGAQVTAINVSPNGKNINNKCGALHPESLIEKVREVNASIGFAFDGDGDRVIAVTSNGALKDGDDLLCLLLSHPAYQQTDLVVGTVMTNYGFENYLKNKGKKLVRTKVGDRYVSQALLEYGVSLGGETSGHLILQDYLPTGDGLFVALRVLETVVLTNNWNLETFPKYPQVMVNIPVGSKKDLKDDPLHSLISSYEKMLSNGRLIVRYSGTENVLRIMVEDRSYAVAQTTANALACKLQQVLQ